jgi:hypothetical protein
MKIPRQKYIIQNVINKANKLSDFWPTSELQTQEQNHTKSPEAFFEYA